MFDARIRIVVWIDLFTFEQRLRETCVIADLEFFAT